MKHLVAAILIASAAAVPLAARAEASADTKTAIAAARVDYDRARKAIDRMDWGNAIAALESAARHDPADAEFQNLLGFAHRNKGDMDAAFRHYFRALELNPSHKGAHEYIGRAYLMVDQPGKAREHLRLLEKACWEVCRERDLLKRAIEEYPWPSEPRLSSRGY